MKMFFGNPGPEHTLMKIRLRKIKVQCNPSVWNRQIRHACFHPAEDGFWRIREFLRIHVAAQNMPLREEDTATQQ